MASANFDNLHLMLSRKLQDPVSAAGTDGTPYTSAQRTDYLNRANHFIQLIVWRQGRDLVDKFLAGLVKAYTVTWDLAGVNLAILVTDYQQHLSCIHDGTRLLTWVPPSRKTLLDNDQNRNLDRCYTILQNKLYGYYNYAQLTSGTGTFYYMQNDTRASNGDTNDISIDSIWYDTLVDIAASFALDDRGNSDLAKADATRVQMVLSVLGMK
jgi:hypothetical protein